MRVRPAPEARRYEAWIVADFAAGRELVRSLAQADALPDVTRLSDETETRVSLGLAGAARAKRALLDAYLRLRRRARRLPGDLRLGGRRASRSTAAGRSSARAAARAAARCRSARRPGAAWERGRFDGPVPARRADRPRLPGRDARDLAHLVAPRRALPRRSARRSTRALRDQGTPGIVMCHLSHAYRDGASLYFTFVARGARRRGDRAVARGRRPPPARRSSPPAATITHHHAIGRDHAPYMARRGRGDRARGAAGAQGAPRPGRDHEPRQAAARLAAGAAADPRAESTVAARERRPRRWPALDRVRLISRSSWRAIVEGDRDRLAPAGRRRGSRPGPRSARSRVPFGLHRQRRRQREAGVVASARNQST